MMKNMQVMIIGEDAYAQGVGSQAQGFSDPLQFDSEAVIFET